MSARIDGAQWTATAVTTVSNANNILSVGAANATSTVAFAVQNPSVGTFPINGQSFHNAQVTLIPSGSTAAWVASAAGGTGTIIITTLTSTTVAGSFSFTAVPTSSPATGNKVVTDGLFNLTF